MTVALLNRIGIVHGTKLNGRIQHRLLQTGGNRSSFFRNTRGGSTQGYRHKNNIRLDTFQRIAHVSISQPDNKYNAWIIDNQ